MSMARWSPESFLLCNPPPMHGVYQSLVAIVSLWLSCSGVRFG